MIRLMCIICLLSMSCLAESPAELLNSTSNLSLPEAAFLLATHGYQVTYDGDTFWLNGTDEIEKMI